MLVIYYSSSRQTKHWQTIEFYYNKHSLTRDFEIKFMIFNLNSFKVLGPLAIMVHTWTLGGDLSTGNWNENLNGKLWFWIWKSHGAHKEYFSFYCMLMNYGKNRVLWVSIIEVMTTWWPNILPPNPEVY